MGSLLRFCGALGVSVMLVGCYSHAPAAVKSEVVQYAAYQQYPPMHNQTNSFQWFFADAVSPKVG